MVWQLPFPPVPPVELATMPPALVVLKGAPCDEAPALLLTVRLPLMAAPLPGSLVARCWASSVPV